MPSTYSPSLRLELIGAGEQAANWGNTTNYNLGTLLEQAIAGVQSVAVSGASYTLTTGSGVADEARNAVLVLTGTLAASCNVIVPTADKTYTFRNATTGGFSVVVKTASGLGVTIANGFTQQVYCDATDVVAAGVPFNAATNTIATNVSGNVTGNVSGNVTGNVTGTAANVTGTVAVANGGTGATDAATARSNLGLGSIATQSAASVAITGGSISGITDLAVADGGTGASDAATARTNLGSAASGLVTGSGLTVATARLLGRTTAGSGAIEELTAGTGLTLSAGDLSVAFPIRAWVNFNGTGTVAIRASGGVTSITDNNTGDYTVNLNFTMPDTNYSVVGNAAPDTATIAAGVFLAPVRTTTSVRVLTSDNNTDQLFDYQRVDLHIVR